MTIQIARGNLLPPLHGLLCSINSNSSFYDNPIGTYHAFCYTSRREQVGTRISSMEMGVKRDTPTTHTHTHTKTPTKHRQTNKKSPHKKSTLSDGPIMGQTQLISTTPIECQTVQSVVRILRWNDSCFPF